MTAEAIPTLKPTLRKIQVSASRLILYPNNPRFLTQDDDRIGEEHYLDPGVGESTSEKMLAADDAHRIRDLENSILKNGWEPVDQIFVTQYRDSDFYVVQEGNRRVAAVRRLLKRPDVDSDIKKSIESLEVMEIVSDCGEDQMEVKISYLLGVRHHGALKQWTPFAQAHSMWGRYLRLAAATAESFQWNDTKGQQVADALSIDLQTVKRRLRVYRIMQQIDGLPDVKKVGGIRARYYSVCEEPLLKGGRSKLPEYIKQDTVTFLLDDQSLERIDKVCHFSAPGRDGAPIHNIPEWRHLDKILQDDDPQRCEDMLNDVEENKRHPSDVWAEREVELYLPRWDTWLKEVALILARVRLGDDLESEEAKAAAQRLANLLEGLDAQSVEEKTSHD